MASEKVGMTRQQFNEWLETCPADPESWFIADDDWGYARVFFSIDEFEDEEEVDEET